MGGALCFASRFATGEGLQPMAAVGQRAITAYTQSVTDDMGEFRSAQAWEEAARELQQATRQTAAPARWQAAAHFFAGQRALRVAAREQARLEFHKSVQLDPTWPLPHVALSELECMEAPATALDHAKLALELGPELLLARVKLAAAYVCLGEIDQAIAQYRSALKSAPKSAAVKAELTLALHCAGGPYDLEAERLAREQLQSGSPTFQAHLVLAERAMDEGAAQRAHEHAVAASVLAPDSPAVQLATGDAFQWLNQMAPAEAAWRVAIDLARKHGPLGAPPYRLQEVTLALGRRRLPVIRSRARLIHSALVDNTRRLRPNPERSRPANKLSTSWSVSPDP